MTAHRMQPEMAVLTRELDRVWFLKT